MLFRFKIDNINKYVSVCLSTKEVNDAKYDYKTYEVLLERIKKQLNQYLDCPIWSVGFRHFTPKHKAIILDCTNQRGKNLQLFEILSCKREKEIAETSASYLKHATQATLDFGNWYDGYSTSASTIGYTTTTATTTAYNINVTQPGGYYVFSRNR